MYRVTEQELEQLCDSGNLKTLDVSLFTLCVGALIAVVVTLTTVDIPNPAVHGSYVAGALVAGIGAIFFGVRAVLAWRNTDRELKRLKNPTA